MKRTITFLVLFSILALKTTTLPIKSKPYAEHTVTVRSSSSRSSSINNARSSRSSISNQPSPPSFILSNSSRGIAEATGNERKRNAFSGTCAQSFKLKSVNMLRKTKDVCIGNVALSAVINACKDGYTYSWKTSMCHNFQCFLDTKESLKDLFHLDEGQENEFPMRTAIAHFERYTSHCFEYSNSCQAGWKRLRMKNTFENQARIDVSICFRKECGSSKLKVKNRTVNEEEEDDDDDEDIGRNSNTNSATEKKDCVMGTECPNNSKRKGRLCYLQCPKELKLIGEHCVKDAITQPECPEGSRLRTSDNFCVWERNTIKNRNDDLFTM